MLDIVYPIKSPTEELKYSIRSVVTNASHLINQIWIVGDLPSWSSGLQHLPAGNPFSRVEDFRAKVFAAASHPEISEHFLLMHDDFFLTEHIEQFTPYHMGPLKEHIETKYKDPNTSRKYIRIVETTYNWMLSQGYENQLTWQGHRPLIWDKKKLVEALTRYPKGLQLDVVGLYEMAGVHGDSLEGVNSKVQKSDESFNEKLKELNHPWISGSDEAFSKGLFGKYIQEMFTEPSIYELPNVVQ